MVNRIVGLHFSPRGGTATITERITGEIFDRLSECDLGEVTCESYDLFRRPEEMPELDENTVVVIGMPTRIGKLPMPAIRLLREAQGAGAMTVDVVSYGTNSYGNALYELYDLTDGQGFKVIGAGAFIAKHAGVSCDVLKRPDAEDIKEIRDFASAVAGKIKRLAGCDVEGLRIKPAPIYVDGKRPVHRISRVSPKAAAAAELALEKIFVKRKNSEWHL